MNKEKINSYERWFKIAKTNNTIDLSGSIAVVNNIASEAYFEREAFQITFTTQLNNKSLQYSMLVNANECFCEIDVQNLKKELQIHIEGCGMNFTILNYASDFSIQFDTINSSFINTPTVQEGSINFHKQVA
ncbi:hypothetical protein [Tenacibaculum agarivorans]|uniref:hypothetical protein n=1 Tax=Tenacibaculum agarivorans TaxID=1908389 RepID=UPI00094B813A|nr:hypothetical protein [Tenacibaculum agarivorans]